MDLMIVLNLIKNVFSVPVYVFLIPWALFLFLAKGNREWSRRFIYEVLRFLLIYEDRRDKTKGNPRYEPQVPLAPKLGKTPGFATWKRRATDAKW
jgi:hypothetical protein